MHVTESAPAKLNLALHVRARRADGYHEIETLFAFCADGDSVRVAPADAPRFSLTGPFAAALAGEGDNLVQRAVRLFGAAFGIDRAYGVTLDKHLPVASGIGGGSADAAAALRALARLNGIAIDDRRVADCAAKLGADVPACLSGRTALGSGRGELLTPIDGLADTPVLLVNPGVAISTAMVFAGWDGIDRGAIAGGDLLSRAVVGRNDLEPAARKIAPAIGDVLAALAKDDGVLLTRMSGSGATCFALYEGEAQRAAAHAAIRAAHPDYWCLETALA